MKTGPNVRHLAALLRTLRREGVSRFRQTPDGTIFVTFGAPPAPEVTDERRPNDRVDWNETDAAGDPDLPPGTPDPRRLLDEIYRRRAGKDAA